MNERGAILITGATGFLGSEIAARLLCRDDRPLLCLVRADSAAAAARSGHAALAGALGRPPTAAEASRVRWLDADLETFDLGMPAPVRRFLARTIEEIFHCAEPSALDLPLEAARRINLVPVRLIHALAAEAAALGRFRQLHYVSTAYAAGRTRGRIGAECLPPDTSRRFRNTYERVKAEAERFLRRCSSVSTTIYRPSIIVGDSRTGRAAGWRALYPQMMLAAAGRLPVVPRRGAARVDCVPVDYVADAIVALGARADSAGATFHLTAGTATLSVSDVIRHTYAGIARQRGGPLRLGTRTVGPIRWWLMERAHRLRARGPARETFDGLRAYVPYTQISSVFDNTREAGLLAGSGVCLPHPRDFFPRVVDYALAHDFGRRPAAPACSAGAVESPARGATTSEDGGTPRAQFVAAMTCRAREESSWLL